ncbi:hypothetical protein KIH87_04615 [Paraneptunicella aestuarii]|uniref:sialate O-acetylesterase n=1 Tax=Paraneptunicella aestuarii TaxID=2831148 RepID=UPI001E4D8BF9|nr:sialate O-acetylesterase [Paraneptunicella aestuarii]UAA39645.1 hypothetical protein KIH87_04615 [Paraneptunicella aestuarii]
MTSSLFKLQNCHVTLSKSLLTFSIALLLSSCGGSGNTISNQPPPPPPPVQEITQYSHIFTYGQSLSRGALALPIISNAQPYGNMTFSEGVHARASAEGYALDAFMPLVEEEVGNQGETPTSGTLNYLVELIETEDNIPWDQQESAYIGSAPGRRGYPIDLLHKGSIYWTAMMEQVQAAKTLTEAEELSYRVAAITWTQGETDYANNTPRETYTQLFSQMSDDFVSDVTAITGQSEPPILITYQIAAHRRYEKDDFTIALSQKDVAAQKEQVYLATPMYHLEYGDDNLHLTAEGSLMLGKYYGLVAKKVLIDGTEWEPLQPETISWTPNAITIALHVPQGELTIDTETVSEAPNYGFDIWNAENTQILDVISSVSLNGSNITIQLSQEVPAGSRLTYARGRPEDPFVANRTEGPRGNIRDSQGDSYQYLGQDGITRRLDNYLVMFQVIKP